MVPGPSIAVTADLHWGHHGRGNAAVTLLVEQLQRQPPDLLLVAGDIGTADHFGSCLGLFDGLGCAKALVAGNHDIWVAKEDPRGDSLDVYERHLAAEAAAHGFHYLDAGPLVFARYDLAVVGSINWYDYSWAIADLRRLFPEEEWRLSAKRFSRGQHNDANFVRRSLDDVAFTARAAETLENHLETALRQTARAIVVAHHPPARVLSFPEPEGPPDLDRLLWRALMGNQRVEDILYGQSERVPLVFCGHTHRARQAVIGSSRAFNVGGDYHFKQLIWFDSPDAPAVVHRFGDPVR